VGVRGAAPATLRLVFEGTTRVAFDAAHHAPIVTEPLSCVASHGSIISVMKRRVQSVAWLLVSTVALFGVNASGSSAGGARGRLLLQLHVRGGGAF
jgi:hypothetical protein